MYKPFLRICLKDLRQIYRITHKLCLYSGFLWKNSDPMKTAIPVIAIVKKSLLCETPFPSLRLLPFPSPSAALGILLARAFGFMVISFSQSNIAVALITDGSENPLVGEKRQNMCASQSEYLMLSKINRRQWKLTELTCYNPLRANFSFMTIKNLTFYGLFAHRACYLLKTVQKEYRKKK
ncbi:hypothetical protein ARALYDRAFT_312033 [Arabidopsis lyrata subsp. lyrata]|uniref:Uncharacterized protein n=1 Tax=Arabidopsis lyrata subsp. lyrata TaxID=81972 RepID=D7KJV9_ARALL|nr:hypothetical protein ARALYDRAFT_312033 [Arabidopsis lyrata subsp. lyrata]